MCKKHLIWHLLEQMERTTQKPRSGQSESGMRF